MRLVVPRLGDAVERELEKILQSGYLVQGERVQRFEQSIQNLLNVESAVAVSSGTAALHLSLMSLGIGKGDIVLLPAFTFPSTANVVEQLGARVEFVDVNIDTFNIDVSRLHSQSGMKWRAVIPVHLFGVPAEMDPILEFSQEKGIPIVEDAACAFGAAYRGRMCGTIGDVGCFSFHPRKVITTAEGGMIISKRRELIERVRSLRDHGFISREGGRDITVPGLNYRMTELHAAVGISGLEVFGDELEIRENLASLYDQELQNIGKIRIQAIPAGSKRVYQSYTILLPEGISRDGVITQLKAMGVESTVGTYAVHLLSYYRTKYGATARDYPNAALLGRSSITLPLHSAMDEGDVEYVVQCLKKALSG